jgi:cobalt-zinc-cadmium efflux system outer membrane protein
VVQQIEFDVAQGYVNVLLDKALLDFAHQDRESFEHTLSLNELRYKDGQIAYGELLKLRLQALAIGDEVRQAQTALVQARADLVQLLGLLRDPQTLTVAGELGPVAGPSPTLEQLLADAHRDRPDLEAAAATSESAKEALTVQRRQPIPDLGLEADYNHARGVPDSFDLALTVSVPVLDQNRGNVEQAESAYSRARLANEALELQIRAAAAKAIEELRASQEQLAAYQTGAAQARESLEITRHAYEQGSGSLLDFLDAETSYRQVEVSLRNATARQAVAAYNLRFIAGKGVR